MRNRRNTRLTQSLMLPAVVALACSSAQLAAGPVKEVVLASDVRWEPLNPARGDKSPQAATLWGDRAGAVPTGFLVKFVEGFSSPPHIHNVSYRGVVISGLIHNDDPGAANAWMPPGSFWTQPKGEVHITAASAGANLAYIEIEEGPYLVLPTGKSFVSGERAINVDVSNIVWLGPSEGTRVDSSGWSAPVDQPKVAFLWGKPRGDEMHGAFIKLPAGFTGKIHSHGSTFRAVLITGQARYQVDEEDLRTLEPGSYFSSAGKAAHQVSSGEGVGSVIYVRTDGRFEVTPAERKR